MRFEEHLLDDTITSVYGLEVVDLDGDGVKDVVIGSQGESVIAWYRAPGFERRILSREHKGTVGIIGRDLTGSGLPDLIAIGGFGRQNRDTIEYLHWLENNGTGADFPSHFIEQIPYLHRIALLQPREGIPPVLLAASIRGPVGGYDDFGDPGCLWCYRIPEDPYREKWEKRLVDPGLHLNHGLFVGDFNRDGREDVLIGCRDGIISLIPPEDPFEGEWRRTVVIEREASDVFVADVDRDGVEEILSVEPWHGNELALYRCQGGEWKRRLLDDELHRGHAVHGVDVDGDGSLEIMVGCNGGGGGITLYRRAADEWLKEVVDRGGLGVGQMRIVDLDGDGRLDIVAGGLSTGNLKWYRNVPDSPEAP